MRRFASDRAVSPLDTVSGASCITLVYHFGVRRATSGRRSGSDTRVIHEGCAQASRELVATGSGEVVEPVCQACVGVNVGEDVGVASGP